MTQTNAQAQTIYGEDDGYPTRPTTRQRLRKTLVRASRGLLGKAIYVAVSIWGGRPQTEETGQRLPALATRNVQPRRILVIRLDLIGDLVLSMVIVRVLKRAYPAAEIDLISVPASAKVIEGDPDVTRLLGYDPNIWRRPKALVQKKNWRELRTPLKRCTSAIMILAISVFGQWAGVLAALSGAQNAGLWSRSFPGLLTDSVTGKHWTPGAKKHEVDYCLELAQAAGASIEAEDRSPSLVIPAQVTGEIEQLLAAAGIQAQRPLIACPCQRQQWSIKTLAGSILGSVAGPSNSRGERVCRADRRAQ